VSLTIGCDIMYEELTSISISDPWGPPNAIDDGTPISSVSDS
jgi:hypothetical protein